MKVINLFGGPGCGKSTLAAGLFHELKMSGINCEYVTEQAKNFTWEERKVTLACQPYIFAKQMRDIWRLRDKVDYVICDSPLLLSLIYINEEDWPVEFIHYVIAQFNAFDNVNFLLKRKKDYNPVGRNQTEEEARNIDLQIKEMLELQNVDYISVYAGVPQVKKAIL